MSRILAYIRVSTAEQTTENQLREIEAACFHVEPRRVVAETVLGCIPIAQRPGFVQAPGPAGSRGCAHRHKARSLRA